jgi:hypothetical protein
MLDKTAYTTMPAMPQSRVTGQWLGKAQLAARMRARLAAEWYLGLLTVKPTIAMATAAFKVSQPYISGAIADLKMSGATENGNGATKNGNGNDYPVVHDYAKLPFVPNISDLWSHLSDDEREGFVRGHLLSVWDAVERVTA